jgi:signal transduction histidine kinase
MERAVLQALAAFRWVAWAWMAVVLLLSREDLEHPVVAVALVGAALMLTAVWAAAWRWRPAFLCSPVAVVAEVALGAALLVFDGWVFGEGHAFSTSQSLGSVWPLVGVLAAGVAVGPWAGAASGVVLGGCRVVATIWNGESIDSAGRALSLVNTAVLYALSGVLAGYLFRLLVRAEREVSAARAREEVARTLHDGVLQTLALVERRAGDEALARLAREQERELREFLFGAGEGAGTGRGPTRDPRGSFSGGEGAAGDRPWDEPDSAALSRATFAAFERARASRRGNGDLGTALRSAAARFERAFGGRVDVIVAVDVPKLRADVVAAVAGAVGEALTNAGKHGAAPRVTVYAEPTEDGGLFCSVKDDGTGYDTATVPDGVGLSRSVRGRMAELGGRAEVASAPGFGTEVRLWMPA